MSWLARKKFTVLAYAIFFLPAIIIPSVIHDPTRMKAFVYLAWLICTPLSALAGCLGKRRSALFFSGIVSLLIPVEFIWYFAYDATLFPPPREKVAELYIPIIVLSAVFMLPLGFALTYMGTRDTR